MKYKNQRRSKNVEDRENERLDDETVSAIRSARRSGFGIPTKEIVSEIKNSDKNFVDVTDAVKKSNQRTYKEFNDAWKKFPKGKVKDKANKDINAALSSIRSQKPKEKDLGFAEPKKVRMKKPGNLKKK